MGSKTVKEAHSFAYQCYSSIRTGTIGTRLNKGLSIEGICDVPMIQEWKLYAAAKLVFDSFWKDRQRVIEIANKYLEEGLADGDPNDHFDELKGLEAKKKQLLKKIDNLVDLRLAEEVDLVYYKEKKTKLDESLNSVIEKIDELKRSFVASEDDADSKLRVLKYALEKNFQFESDNIPDEILDAFIDKVIVYKDRFEFYLNFTEKGISCLVDGKKNKHQAKLMDTFPTDCDSNTGGDREWEELDNKTYIYLLTIMITQDDVEDFFKRRPDLATGRVGSRVKNFKDIRLDIYI